MKVQEIMTKDVACCEPRTNAAAAAEIMWNRNCGALLVVENGGNLVGIVTDRDLFIALGTGNRAPTSLTVEEVMSRDLAACLPGDDIRTAMGTMAQWQVRRLPVVDQSGALQGILSMDDAVMRAEANGLSNQDVVGTLKAIWGRQVQSKAGDLQKRSRRVSAA
jgi:CBS domain-containing protein